MDESFALDAVLAMAPDADLRAPGGAVTQALCGSLDHAPPCPLAAHHTSARRRDDRVTVRILVASEPSRERDACLRIVSALATGRFRHPDGSTTSWQLLGHARSAVAPDEIGQAERLVRHRGASPPDV